MRQNENVKRQQRKTGDKMKGKKKNALHETKMGKEKKM